MRRWLLLALLMPMGLCAQPPDPPVLVVGPLQPAEPLREAVRGSAQNLRAGLLNLGPLALAVGGTGQGSIAAAFSGRQRVDLGELQSATMIFEQAGFALSSGAYLEFEVDAVWTDAIADTEVLDFSLRPSLDWVLSDWTPDAGAPELSPEQEQQCLQAAKAFMQCAGPRPRFCQPLSTPRAISGISTFADLRYRNAQTEVAGQRTQLKQQFVGGGFEWYLPASTASVWWREFPRLRLAYLQAQQTESSSGVVPPELEGGFYSAHARLRMNLPLFKRIIRTPRGCDSIDYPLQLHADLSGTRAESGPAGGWQAAWSVRLVFDTGAALLPVLEHRGGTELGLKKDERLIVGLQLPLGSRWLN